MRSFNVVGLLGISVIFVSQFDSLATSAEVPSVCRNIRSMESKPLNATLELPLSATMVISLPRRELFAKDFNLKQRVINLVKSGAVDQALKLAQSANAVDRGALKIDIAETLTQMGRVPQALQIVRLAENQARKDEMLETIALTITNDPPQAVQVAQIIREQSSRTRVLTFIAVSLADQGAGTTAIAVIQNIERHYDRDIALGITASWSVGFFGRTTQGLQILERIDDAQVKAATQAQIAVGLSHRKQFPQAVQLAQTIADCTERSTALVGIAESSRTFGEVELIPRVLAQAEQSVELIDSPGLRVPLLVKIAAQYRELKEIQSMRSRLSQALKNVPAMRYPPSQIETLTNIASQYRRAGLTQDALPPLAEALRKAQKLPDSNDKRRLLADIRLEYTKLGQKDQARKISPSIQPYLHNQN